LIKNPIMVKAIETIISNIKQLPSTRSALTKSFFPRNIDTLTPEPTPISIPKALIIIIIGKTTLSPVSAIAPTPCPTKILSTILYNELTTTPVNAGRKNFHKTLRIGASPSNFMFLLLVSNL